METVAAILYGGLCVIRLDDLFGGYFIAMQLEWRALFKSTVIALWACVSSPLCCCLACSLA